MSTAQAKKTKIKKIKQEIFLFFAIFLVLFLTAANINKHFTPFQVNPVLGASTEIDAEDFWKEFLTKNQNYIPGWIEIGRIDKANQIDPNYFLQ